MIRVALVGACGVASAYRQGYARIPNVQWKVAVDVDGEKVKKCLAEGCQRVSTKFEDALADDVDVVDVWTPNHLHEEQAVRALEAGKHVLLQKPITNTLAGADRIVATARRMNKTAGMYMTLYNNPLLWELKEMIQQGLFGEIQNTRARNAYPFQRHNTLGPENWRSDQAKVGGGCFIQLSIHSINLLQWLVGRRVTEVMGYAANQYSQGMVGGEDVAIACVKYGNDNKSPMGIFDASYAADDVSLEIYGTRGFFKLERNGEITLSLGKNPYQADKPFSFPMMNNMASGEPVRFRRAEPHDSDVSRPCNQHRMFFTAIQEGRPPHVTAEDGRHDLAVCMAVYESSRIGRAVRV
ncbi:MAG: Gfo/Idh/MocA family oxidoreductase [Phycisphaerales bacterium]|nr:Gfo/Idh/MocA family oxidoreductase [Phycisphaerales bacterium]